MNTAVAIAAPPGDRPEEVRIQADGISLARKSRRTLLVPFIIALFASEKLPMGFGVVVVILALVFGLLGWQYKTGRVAVTICAGLAVLSLAIFVLVFQKAKAREEYRREQAATRAAEMPDHP